MIFLTIHYTDSNINFSNINSNRTPHFWLQINKHLSFQSITIFWTGQEGYKRTLILFFFTFTQSEDDEELVTNVLQKDATPNKTHPGTKTQDTNEIEENVGFNEEEDQNGVCADECFRLYLSEVKVSTICSSLEKVTVT